MTDSLPSVAVLLSTYNGEKYLTEQIESILCQKDVQVRLIVRDDGSKDGTLRILSSYGERIRVHAAENAGVGRSFMELVSLADPECGYFAFADQDDIWLPEKLGQAVRMLEGRTGPALYGSNQTLVDKAGSKLRERYDTPADNSYLQVLSNNLIAGCTMVWNRELQALLSDPARRPSDELLAKRIHDVWVGMAAACTGEYIYDPRSFILYRQHEDNVVGAQGTSTLQEWKKKLKDPKLRNGRSLLAKEILEKFDDRITDPEIRTRLNRYAYYQENRQYRKELMQDEEVARRTGESMRALRTKVLMKVF